MKRPIVTVDGNEATAFVAHKCSEVIAIYPITPSSTMGELADEWSGKGIKNIWGSVPSVIEMQSEGGASGAVHGAAQTGSLTTTFTASQGLLLMIPNMFKMAGELTASVFHISARALATHALSIFGDHSDVMAVRQTGWAMIVSNSVQEAQDMAMIAHSATLKSRVPFVHFFDGFRTSAEVNKIEQLTEDDIRSMMDDKLISQHRERALSPDRPKIRGTAQNPDVFFQERETINPFYTATPALVQETMDQYAKLTGRAYKLFDYVGAPDADRVIVVMGSGAETVETVVEALLAKKEKVGVLKVHLYRPFSVEHFIKALPASVKSIAVLDRTKEPGAAYEPLHMDVVSALTEALANTIAPFSKMPRVIGGRFGLGSKEFTPGMAKAVFDELAKPSPKDHFTVGINDDVSKTSLDYDASYSVESDETTRCIFWGLGSDGTVGANKNSIKIISDETPNYGQGYFYYDSKKSGTVTLSHLRFGAKPIRAPYLVRSANFVACHQFTFLEKYDTLETLVPGGVFLLNSIYSVNEVWDKLPREDQKTILDKKIRFYVIDAYQVAAETGMGNRINTIMQTCFFAISGVLPRDEAIEQIKKTIKKTYGKRGEAVVKKNFDAVDSSLANLHEVKLDGKKVSSNFSRTEPVPANAPDFVKKTLGPMIALRGDDLPVSAFPVDGTYPLSTTMWEKRNIALEIPVWEPSLCIQCGKCVMVCPHAVIRQKVYAPELLAKAPATFKSMEGKFKEFPGTKYTIQVAPEDCTGCTLCVDVCPAKDKTNTSRKALNMAEQPPLRESERANWEFFLTLPEADRTAFSPATIKNSQLLQPLFEFSGACAGCGETPYIKLVTQLFGDRMIIANATGCSSIYGGNLPTTPYAANHEGRGPAWSNSLFEDNAEFGLGMRLSLDKQKEFALELLAALSGEIGDELVKGLKEADQSTDSGIRSQRERVDALQKKLAGIKDARATQLAAVADSLVNKSVWIVGGDGWAYDIGYGGLDHVLASGRNVNLLVLDTEVYSNTGGQASKATPLAAVAKFASRGKPISKKDLGLIAMAYGYVYVGRIAMGANDQHTLKTIIEAEAFDGPSLLIAYSHCIQQGIDTKIGLDQQKLAVQTGIWPLYRYNPNLAREGKNPFVLDSKDPTIPLDQYAYNETRYRMLLQSDEARAEALMKLAKASVASRWEYYKQLAAMSAPAETK